MYASLINPGPRNKNLSSSLFRSHPLYKRRNPNVRALRRQRISPKRDSPVSLVAYIGPPWRGGSLSRIFEQPRRSASFHRSTESVARRASRNNVTCERRTRPTRARIPDHVFGIDDDDVAAALARARPLIRPATGEI